MAPLGLGRESGAQLGGVALERHGAAAVLGLGDVDELPVHGVVVELRVLHQMVALAVVHVVAALDGDVRLARALAEAELVVIRLHVMP